MHFRRWFGYLAAILLLAAACGGDTPAAGPVTIETDEFRFTEDFRGLEVIARAGTVIGHDGDRPIPTPYDDCVLIMPSRRLRRGESAVRFGRFVAPP